MAASAATASSSPGLCPNYAVICSFLERYGALLDLPELTFPQLERYLQDTSSVPKLLVDLHVKLLRKIGKSVSADRWEKYLVKVCQEFNTTWAWELEQKGYKELTVECKTGILKYLCECQFDDNVKFKTAINDEDPDKMRLQPIGRDKDGQMYWFQLDQDNNVRVYVEEQDDLDGSSWKCIVRDRNDLAEVVALLKTQIDPALLKKEQETKPEGKRVFQYKNQHKKAQNIKEEPMEVVDTKSNSSEQTPASETLCTSVKEEKGEEPKKSSAEEMQQAMKNDQQAKIPLKKRGMKFSEDFDKNNAVIVQNPSLSNLKEAAKDNSTPDQSKKALSINDHINGEVNKTTLKESHKILTADESGNLNLNHEVESKEAESKVSKQPEEKLDCTDMDTSESSQTKEAEAPENITHKQTDTSDSKETGSSEGNVEKTDSFALEEKPESCKTTETQSADTPEKSVDSETSESKSVTKKTSEKAEETANTKESVDQPVIEKVDKSDSCKAAEKHDGIKDAEMAPTVCETKTEKPEDIKKTVNCEDGTVRDASKISDSVSGPVAAEAQGAKLDVTKPQKDDKADMNSVAQKPAEQPSEGQDKTPSPVEKTDTSDEKPETEQEKDSEKNPSAIEAEHPSSDNKKDADRESEKDTDKEKLSNCKEDSTADELSKTEESKGKSEDVDSQAKKDVANGSEAPADVQEEDVCRKNKRPVNRRKVELQREERQGDSESDTNVGRSLRRSPRISRPTPKAVQIQDKKQEKSQAPQKRDEEKGEKEKCEDEEDKEEEVVKVVKKKPREKKTDQEEMLLLCYDLPVSLSQILLCDSCDSGYHTACLRPPLMIIPDGEWFCPPCQHKQLCDKLEEHLCFSLTLNSFQVEVEEEKPEIIIKEKKETKKSKSWGRRSTRAKKTISYRYETYYFAACVFAGAGRGKDMANITGHRGKDISTILQAEEGKENGQPPRPSASQRRKKRRRLNDLDSDSTVDEEESEEEFRLSESSEEEFVVTDNDTEAESEADSNNSDFGSNGSGRHRKSSRSRLLTCRRSSRKRRRPRGYSDDEEDETDDDDEDEIGISVLLTEGSSEYSDSDLDMSRRRSRRSQKKQVNYCETSESEGSQAETNQDSDESSEEDRPIRKRVNRIDSDDDDDEEQQEEKPKEKKAEEESKGTNALDCGLVELPPANGQSPIKSLEGIINRPAATIATITAPGIIPHLEPPKSISATPAAAIAPNGLVGQDIAAQDDDEDDLLGVTDLVDYVCNNEQL
uniref:Remodeling and spacing factor 1b, tandem duplicate 1 n=1 Tax=Maylandia zebra TaxID=106582 RepID=A0A3P9BXX5_9CICH